MNLQASRATPIVGMEARLQPKRMMIQGFSTLLYNCGASTVEPFLASHIPPRHDRLESPTCTLFSFQSYPGVSDFLISHIFGNVWRSCLCAKDTQGVWHYSSCVSLASLRFIFQSWYNRSYNPDTSFPFTINTCCMRKSLRLCGASEPQPRSTTGGAVRDRRT
jgi:hypothetical protein